MGARDVGRLVGEHRPPEDEADGDEQRVLDVERPRVLEREVVEERQMDRVPADEPDRQRDPRAREAGERPSRRARAIAGAHRRRQPEEEERRRPVGDHHVLEQVEEQEVIGGDRLEGRVERAGDQQEADREEDDPPEPAGRSAAQPGSTRTAATAASARKSGSKVNEEGAGLTPRRVGRPRRAGRAGGAGRGGGGRRTSRA